MAGAQPHSQTETPGKKEPGTVTRDPGVPLWVSHHYSRRLGQVINLFVTFFLPSNLHLGASGGLNKMRGKTCVMCDT